MNGREKIRNIHTERGGHPTSTNSPTPNSQLSAPSSPLHSLLCSHSSSHEQPQLHLIPFLTNLFAFLHSSHHPSSPLFLSLSPLLAIACDDVTPSPSLPLSHPNMPRRNGLVTPQAPPLPFHCSTLSLHSLCRLIHYLLLLFRFASFSFSLSSAVFMASDLKPSISVWTHVDAFRFVVAASGIVAVYSFVEMGVSAWEILRGTTPLPEIFQLWFDFGHDQAFAYLLLSATAAATVEVRKQWAAETCKRENGFCVQATISVAMAFVAFLFLASSAVLSGFRLACYSITGSRFYL